jgi:hypothetical protein
MRRNGFCALALQLLLAACGGDDSSADADGDAPDAADDAVDAPPDGVGDLPVDGGDDAPVEDAADVPPDGPPSALGIWANTGEDKVTRDDLRAAAGGAAAVVNSAWDGARVKLFGARNEVVSFNLVLEAAAGNVGGVSVTLESLAGPGGATIGTRAAAGDALFDWRGRNIELFYVRYLAIRGLSALAYDTYDERHVPERFRRPWTGEGIGSGGWTERPDADKEYPDIAVPLELETPFDVAAGTSQAIWVDIYVPNDAPAGDYTGTLHVRDGSGADAAVGVDLVVRDFALPDAPHLGTMLFYSYSNINNRYLGEPWPWEPADLAASLQLVNRHFQLAHRHRISLIGDEGSDAWEEDRPRPDWEPRLDGTLFTPAEGYEGPGEGLGNGIYSIGTYGGWGWQDEGQAGMRTHTDGWARWFAANAPGTEYFLYLIDESDDFAQIEEWSGWIETNPGPGRDMLAFATTSMLHSRGPMPSLDVPCTWAPAIGDPAASQTAVDYYVTTAGKRAWMYNGYRPWTGSYVTEDDGVALRVTAWSQYAKRISRWFYWESTYYENFQGGTGETDVFASAHTFGGHDGPDDERGETGWNYTNGDGVLFYPGTDRVFPERSYDVAGPFASLRLKFWRRGIQDGDYLALAEALDPAATRAVLDSVLPRTLWDYGVSDPGDPTWVRTDISWSNDPDAWEAARAALADIIDGG